MAKDPSTWGQKWQNNAQGAQTAFTEGVQNTDKDPIALALANEAGLVAGFQEAVSSGRWRQNLSRVGKAGWQQATIAKAGNYGTGIAAGRGRYDSAMQTWGPVINATAQAARSMPGANLSQRLARSNYFATTLYNRKRGQ